MHMNSTPSRTHRLSRRLALPGLLASAALASGCAVYPYYPAAPVAYGDPYGGYGPAAPVVVAPAPVYYGPAYPAFYPSISIHGRFGDGRGGHRGHRGGHRGGHRH